MATAQVAEDTGESGSEFGFGFEDFDVQASGTFAPTLSAEVGATQPLDGTQAVGTTPTVAGATSTASSTPDTTTPSVTIVVPVIDRTSPVPAQAGGAFDLFGSGFSSRNRALFTGNGITVEMVAISGVPYWATINLPRDLPLGTYTVTVTNTTATSAPFTVTVVPR